MEKMREFSQRLAAYGFVFVILTAMAFVGGIEGKF